MDPVRRDRSAARAGDACRPVPDAARTRSGGLACRASPAWHDRRRHPRAAVRVGRRASRTRHPGVPLRRHRSRHAPRRAHPRRVRHPLGRRALGHRPPARAGTPKNRDDRRTEGVGGDRGAGERVSGRTRRGRRPPFARARRRRRLRDRRRLPGGAAAPRDRRPADRSLRLQRQHGDRGATSRDRARHGRAGSALDRGVRRLPARPGRDAGAHDGPAAARGDGPDGREPAHTTHRRSAGRDAPHRARDPPRAARVNCAAAARRKAYDAAFDVLPAWRSTRPRRPERPPRDLARLAESRERLLLGESFALHQQSLGALDRLARGERLGQRVRLVAQSRELFVPGARVAIAGGRTVSRNGFTR